VATRRRSGTSSPDGPQWTNRIAAVGTLLAGLAAAVAVIVQQTGSGPATPPASLGQGPTATPTADATAATPSPSAPADPLLVRSVEGLPAALVQITTTGTFVDAFGGPREARDQGSGFLIDASGIALTNSDVVIGAESITAHVGDERAAHTAEVLGVSECAGVAVIKLESNDPMPHLGWFDGPVRLGQDVVAAGSAPGESRPAVARGIISSVGRDDTIQHDGTVQDGWTGGPVVTSDGQVVAVNLGPSDLDGPAVAISRDALLPLLPDLLAARDVGSAGIVGYVVDGLDPTGIWVASVEPDSPAGRAGILPGDIVTALDDRPLAEDGTMASYCDVLRDHQPDDALDFTLYRYDDRATLTGTLNGDPVEPGFSFARVLDVATEPGAAYADEPISDEDDVLYVEVPPTWSDHEADDWSFRGTRAGPGLVVSPDTDAFRAGWRTPGAYVAASATLQAADLEPLLDAARTRFEDDCVLVDRATFFRGGYTGTYDLWETCHDTATQFITLAAEKDDGSHVVYVQFQAPDVADVAVLDRMLVALEFTPEGS